MEEHIKAELRKSFANALTFSLVQRASSLAHLIEEKNSALVEECNAGKFDLSHLLDLFDDVTYHKVIYNAMTYYAEYAELPRPPEISTGYEMIASSLAVLINEFGAENAAELSAAIRAVQKKYEHDIRELNVTTTKPNYMVSSAGTLDRNIPGILFFGRYASFIYEMYNYVFNRLAKPRNERSKPYEMVDLEAHRKQVVHSPDMAEFEGNEEFILMQSQSIWLAEEAFWKAFADL